MQTYRDLHAVIALELGDVLVPPGQLGAVERPEATHHLDAGLRRVRHLLGRCDWMERSVVASRSDSCRREPRGTEVVWAAPLTQLTTNCVKSNPQLRGGENNDKLM